jgi:hypothetical protein
MTSILALPYLSQVDGPGAGNFVNDCGPACVAMLVHGAQAATPTIADVFRATGAGAKDYTGSGQLAKAAKKWNIGLDGRFWTLQSMKASLDAGFPIIGLVHYGAFSATGKTESKFKGGHWLLIVGHSPGPSPTIIVHDPLWKQAGGRYLSWPEALFWNAWEQNRIDKNSPFFGIACNRAYGFATDISNPASPVPQNPEVWGVGTVLGTLRLRHHPPNGDTILFLKAGDTVDVLEPKRDGWWHVRTVAAEGWCGGSYVSVIEKPPALPPVPAPAPTLPQFDGLPDAEKWRLVRLMLVQTGIVGQDGSVLRSS